MRKLALVIGNEAYEHASALDAPRRDAVSMAMCLEAIGFEALTGFDCDLKTMRAKMADFEDRLNGDTLALFYFSGHGIAAQDGTNYMLPVNAEIVDPDDIRRFTFSVDRLLAAMRERARVSLLFLDACRDDPFHETEARTGRKNVVVTRHGLAPVDRALLGQALIGFAAEAGQTALDAGNRQSSPFTAALIENLKAPGIDIRDVMQNVRRAVLDRTQGRQTPWTKDALTEDVYLVSAPAPKDDPAAEPVAAPDPTPPMASGPDPSIIALMQRRLAAMGLYGASIDGERGLLTDQAVLNALRRVHGPASRYESWSNEARLVALLQSWCVETGFEPGPIDGQWGPWTAAAATQMQAAVGRGDIVLGPPPTKPDFEAVIIERRPWVRRVVAALGVLAFLVVGTAALYESMGHDRTPLLRSVGQADRGAQPAEADMTTAAGLSTLIPTLRDSDADAMAMVVKTLTGALGGTALSDTEKAKLADRLLDAATPGQITTLPGDGPQSLLQVLAAVPAALWLSDDGRDRLAEATDIYEKLSAGAADRSIYMTRDTQAMLARWGRQIGYFPRDEITVDYQVAGYAKSEAAGFQGRLRDGGWKVLGLPDFVAAAAGKAEIRYGATWMVAPAQLLARDLSRVSGRDVKVRLFEAVADDRLEIWLGR